MRWCLVIIGVQCALADLSEESVLLQLPARTGTIGKCWHWITDKFWDGLAWDDQEGDDNFVGKMLNPSLGEQTYGSGASLSMDVSALTLSGIISLAAGEKAKFRLDKSIEGWQIHDNSPCRGTIKARDVTASCCNGANFALASFPRLGHVAILVESKKPGTADGYSYYVLDPTFNQFQENKVDRRKVKVLMEELSLANQEVQRVSGAMEAKGPKATGLANYDGFKQYFISMQTFFDNGGDLRYALNGSDARYRTFRSEPDPTVAFGHGPLLERAGWRWGNGTSALS